MKKHKKEHYIIDGYNVINSWPELVALRDNLSYARDRLINIMAEYGAFEHYDITIVFDALFVDGNESHYEINENLVVVYTEEGETADSYIEKFAYQLVREGKEVYVVTSDGIEQSVILGAGAYRIPSKEMLRNVKKTKKKIAEEYTLPKHKIQRRELGGRINDDIAKKLDILRKKQ